MARTQVRNSSPAMMSDQEAIAQLETDFPKLDGALIAPIYYDTHCAAAARKTLEILYATIDDEANSNGSGSGGVSPANSCPEWGESNGDWASETDQTTASLASSNFGFGEGEEEDEEGEMGPLRKMFPTMSRFSLEKTLERAGGDLERAIDELLNRVSLEEGGDKAKGVDGFGEEVMFQRKKRKGKGKAAAPGLQRRLSLPPEGTENTPVARGASVWDKKSEEIHYISTCLGLPKTVVAFAHNANGVGASSPREPTSAAAAQDDGSNWTVVGTSLRPTHPTSPKPLDYTTSAQLAEVYRHARDEAFQKAAASYRRSKSDRFMGGVAAVYAEQGHEYHARTKEYENRAAEQYVTENSGEGVLDLHGVTVSQAVKIANERTTRWWAEVQPDADSRGFLPFRIVTGIGRHSTNGEAKLTPAVSRMLQRGGWRIEVGRGEILVYGVL